ncbi:tRNA pseudouridine(13) synthase TruD [Marinimicrobium sp. ARAG 43.8]|uniref:tRNA pseudouridine(13) synthase TruD n=1 Tax=Marinimicrobium sp. ARAG 43.8 TaxID=3418719 RepID=UPI003CF30391
MPDFDLRQPAAHGGPVANAGFRTVPEDFRVNEDLGFEPEGDGEHWLLNVRKRGDNTPWVAGQLARCAGVPVRDVGYCGLKDRHAVTTQWFSIHQPKGAAPDWPAVNSESIQLLSIARHPRKLRRGQHRRNEFVIRLRDVTPVSGQTRDALNERLERVKAFGVPNYFGEQRFGRGGQNLVQAHHWLVDGQTIRQRQQRSLVMSAARAWLFNAVLAERVREGTWREPLSGDPASSPSGPLWGRGRPLSSDACAALEARAMEPWARWCEGLEHVGLQQERRPLVLKPDDLHWRWDDNDLELVFSLPPGTFATAVLAELAHLKVAVPKAASGVAML